jgi:hypothetical protein
MTFKTIAKKIIRRLDNLSPYPLFYPFLMSREEKIVFDEAITKSRHYLEFGLGGSSLRALQKSKAQIYTVESSPEWILQMRKYVYLRYFENKRLHIFHVNIGPTRDWGYPESGSDPNIFEAYSSNIFESIDSRLIDLALVDGRFRVACALKLILACHKNRNFNLLIHDIWNRPQYHVVLKYLDVVKRAHTLGLFTIASDLDLDSARNDYESYKLEPE